MKFKFLFTLPQPEGNHLLFLSFLKIVFQRKVTLQGEKPAHPNEEQAHDKSLKVKCASHLQVLFLHPRLSSSLRRPPMRGASALSKECPGRTTQSACPWPACLAASGV